MTCRARLRHHELRKIVRCETLLIVVAIQEVDNPLNAFAAILDSVKNRALNFCRQLLERQRGVRAKLLGDIADLLFEILVEPAIAEREPAVEQRLGRIADDPRWINVVLHSKSIAGLARAVDAIEGERPWFDRRDAEAAIHASHLFRVQTFFAIHNRDQHDAFCQLERLFDGCFETFFNVRFDQQSIHHDLDRVVLLLIEFDRFIEVVKDSVDTATNVSSFR